MGEVKIQKSEKKCILQFEKTYFVYWSSLWLLLWQTYFVHCSSLCLLLWLCISKMINRAWEGTPIKNLITQNGEELRKSCQSEQWQASVLVFGEVYVYPTPHKCSISYNCIPTATPNKMSDSCHINTNISFVRHGCLTKLRIVYKHQSPNVIRFEIVPWKSS